MILILLAATGAILSAQESSIQSFEPYMKELAVGFSNGVDLDLINAQEADPANAQIRSVITPIMLRLGLNIAHASESRIKEHKKLLNETSEHIESLFDIFLVFYKSNIETCKKMSSLVQLEDAKAKIFPTAQYVNAYVSLASSIHRRIGIPKSNVIPELRRLHEDLNRILNGTGLKVRRILTIVAAVMASIGVGAAVFYFTID